MARTVPARLAKAAAALVVSLGWIALSVCWIEAEKEVRILCGFIRPGMTAERAVEALETGNLLRWAEAPGEGAGAASSGDGGHRLEVRSPWTLGVTRCTVAVTGGVVASSGYRAAFRIERVAAGVATAGFAFLLGFQLLLAGGAPLGEMAWGGRHRILPAPLRLASGVAAAVLAGAVVVVLERVGVLQALGNRAAVDVAAWLLFLLFTVSAVANALGAAPKERRLGLPLAVILAAACLLVALAP